MRYIEMVGLPGAGKTSVRRGWPTAGPIVTMGHLLRRERVRAGKEHRRPLVRMMPSVVTSRVMRGRTPSAGDAAHFSVTHPAFHDFVWARSRMASDANQRTTSLELMWDAWGERGFAERVGTPEEGLLLDEGVWQRLIYLLAISGVRTADDIPALPHPLPSLAALVVMNVPLDVARARVYARPRGFVEVDLLPTVDVILGHLVDKLRAAGTPCLILDGQRPIPESRAELRRFLESGWPPNRPT